jgi:hypothetical protein
MQQICFVIGEINFRLGDLVKAREFFYSAMVNKDGNPVVRRQAEDRLEMMKALQKDTK